MNSKPKSQSESASSDAIRISHPSDTGSLEFPLVQPELFGEALEEAGYYFLLVEAGSFPDHPPALHLAPAEPALLRVVERFDQHDFEKDTLVRAIRSQHQQLEYNGHYIAFLLNQIDEAELQQIATQFAYEPQEYDEQELANRTRILFSSTGIDFSTSDICDLLQCDYEQAHDVLQRLGGAKEFPRTQEAD